MLNIPIVLPSIPKNYGNKSSIIPSQVENVHDPKFQVWRVGRGKEGEYWKDEQVFLV